MEIVFLGTGIMGAPMARRLAQAGHAVTVWNRTAGKAQPLAEHGARVAETPAEAVAGAEVIVTMLTDAAAVEDVMEHEAGEALPAGAIWWQASTVGIEGTEALVELAAEHDLRYVDAPVLGTRGPAEDGQLVVLAAGDPADLDVCAPLFDAVGSKTIRLGEAGEASRFKLVMNHWVVAVTDVIAETIAFAEGVGIAPERFLEAIEGDGLDLGYAHLKGPGMIAGELPVAFPLKHALKDINLILEAARRHDLDLALAETLHERYAAAADAGYADADVAMVIAAMRPSRP